MPKKGARSSQMPQSRGKSSLKKGDLTEALGGSGTQIVNGFIEEDYNPQLTGAAGMLKFEKMRKSDAQVKASILVCELPIRATEKYIDPATEADNTVTPLNQEIADFVHMAIFEKMSIAPDDLWHEILTVLPFGHSVFEKIYTADDEHVWLETLASRKQTTIVKWETLERSAGITQFLPSPVIGGPNDGKQQISIPQEKLLIFTLQREGDNLEGVSILRSAYKHFYMKDQLYKFDVVKHERQGVGVPVLTMPEEAAPEDEARAKTILQSIRANEQGGIVLPFGWKFEYADTKATTGSDMWKSIEHHNAMIAKNVLAMFMEIVSGEGGSRALSEDQSDFFLLALEAVATMIDEVFNRYLIPELVDLNYEGVTEYPKLRHKKLGNVNYKDIMEAINTAVSAGVIGPDFDLEVWSRQLMDLPAKMSPEDRAAIDDEEAEWGYGGDMPIDDGTDIQPVDEDGNPIDDPELDAEGNPLPTAVAEDEVPTEEDTAAAASQVDVQLNGAQITAATTLVAAVAKGEVPRDAGLKQLEILFNLTPEQSIAIMGSAGTTTKLQPNPVAGTVQATEPLFFTMGDDVLAFHEGEWLAEDAGEFRIVSEETKRKISESLKKRGKRSRARIDPKKARQQGGVIAKTRNARVSARATQLKKQAASKPKTTKAKARIGNAIKTINARKKYTEPHEHNEVLPRLDPVYLAYSEIFDNARIVAMQNSVERDDLPALREKGFLFNDYEDQAWRGLTFAERKVSLSSLKKAVEKADLQLEGTMGATTAKMKEDLLNQVKKAVENDDIAAVGKIRAKYTGELASALTDVQKSMFDTGKQGAAAEMGVKAPATRGEVKGALRVGNDKVVEKLAADMEHAAATAVTQVAAKRGGSITSTGVAEAVGAANESIDKVIEASAELRTLTLTGALNMGRAAIFERFPELIYGFQFSAILDDRTTDTCLSLDGRVVKAGSPDFYTYSPPRHYNCRSIWVEILNDEEFKPEFDEIPSTVPTNATIDVHKDMKVPDVRQNSPAVKVLRAELEDRRSKLVQLETSGKYPNRQASHKARIAELEKAIGTEGTEFSAADVEVDVRAILAADGIRFRG